MAKMFRSTERNDTSVTASNADRHESRDAAAAESHGQPRELAHRHNDGLDVTLLWHEATDDLVLRVWDQRQDARFEFRPEPHMALEAYYHPYAYVAPADDVLAP
jgi:hypothetical protein